MDMMTTTEDLGKLTKGVQDNLLLDIIKETCSEDAGKLSPKVRGKVNRIIADCDLAHHSSLHRLSAVDNRTSTLLGLMQQTSTELSFDEQSELNQAIIQKIQTKLPKLKAELDSYTSGRGDNVGELSRRRTRQEYIKELQESLDEKLNVLQQQENEKVDLMMEWLNHRLQEVTQFSENSTELLTLKTRILELKSKILYLQILQNIFTETNQSIKSYREIHKDLKDSIRGAEERIKEYKTIVDNDAI